MKGIFFRKSNFRCRENIYICRPLRRLRRLAIEYVKKHQESGRQKVYSRRVLKTKQKLCELVKDKDRAYISLKSYITNQTCLTSIASQIDLYEISLETNANISEIFQAPNLEESFQC